MCHPFTSTDCTPSGVDRLKLLDDPSSFMKFPQLQPSCRSRWSIDKRDKKPPSMVRGVRRSQRTGEGDREATRFGVQRPACIALVEVQLERAL